MVKRNILQESPCHLAHSYLATEMTKTVVKITKLFLQSSDTSDDDIDIDDCF